jgi:cytochrome c-type biogenesis protein CcmH
MTAFLIVAALMALGAIALVVVPLAWPRAAAAPAAPWLALLCAVAVGGGSALLYPTFSNWSWTKTTATTSPDEMVGALARRLERQPEDLQGWLLLGRSYATIGQYPLAVRAYERADRLAGNKNAEALSGLAEALMMGEMSDLDGRAGKLFEQALALEPNSTKLLFFSAIAALERGENSLARTRFATLLAANPPAEVRTLIEKQIQALDAGTASGAAPGPVAPAPSGAAAAAAPVVATIDLRISLSPKVAAKAVSGAPLFVLARSPGQRGPPLAAKRLDARFPQSVQLSSTDAMIAGSGFVAGQELEVTARISNGGSAIASPGDPVGTVRHRVGDPGPLTIVIDQLTP